MTLALEDMSRKAGLPSDDERLRAGEIAEAASRKASPKKRASSPAAKRASPPTTRLRAEANAGTKLRGANASTSPAVVDLAAISDDDIADDNFDADADTQVVAEEASKPTVLHPLTVFSRASCVAASLAVGGIVLTPKHRSQYSYYIYQFNNVPADASSQQPNIDEIGHGMIRRGGTSGPTQVQPRGPNAITIQSFRGKCLPHVAVYSTRAKKGFKLGKNYNIICNFYIIYSSGDNIIYYMYFQVMLSFQIMLSTYISPVWRSRSPATQWPDWCLWMK
jgi:hypothetical protein